MFWVCQDVLGYCLQKLVHVKCFQHYDGIYRHIDKDLKSGIPPF